MNTDTDATRLAYSTREFAKAVGISISLLYKLLREGRGPPCTMINGRRLIERQAGLAWLQQPDDYDVETKKERKKSYIASRLHHPNPNPHHPKRPRRKAA